MRYFLLLAALWLLSGVAGAGPLPADTAAVRIDRLPAAGLMLNKGWRYHAGDDPAWVRPGFDDRAWDTLNPARPRRELPPSLSNGISWLRLRFQLGDSLRQRALLLQANGYGAWEVYLNGRLVQRAGTVRANPTQVPNPDQLPAIDVPAGAPAEQVLAIRFAPWQSPLLRLAPAKNLLRVYLSSAHQVQQQEAKQLRTTIGSSLVAGIFGLLTLLHLAFFRYYPAQRANLYFALFALTSALYNLIIFNQWAQVLQVLEATLLLRFVAGGLLLSAYLWAVRALYSLFGFRTGWLYRGLWIGLGVSVVLGLYDGAYENYARICLVIIAFVELLRLTGRALRQRQRGVWVIGVGFAVPLVFFLVLLGLFALSVLLKAPALLGQTNQGGTETVITLVALLSPALAISLYLASEFALDSQLLQVKLGEVERLSAQTIAQEQDKQALLAAQNETLETQVHERTGELQRSLTDLRATQAQLIQKEKMASLGELMAGIAHEIQNPLNFVNNFAEVSTELLDELEEEQAKPDRDAGLEAELVGDLRQNLGKISHHGRRAAAIVKGMLEHSRTSTGERAPTDLNQLADEYLRLAYQGLRAKDKTFNATLETDFAPGLPLVEAVAGDVGRVLLNLFSNAFYAVQKRQQTGEAGYKPTVSVRTKRLDKQVEIRISDNGTGIPDEVKAKIFQPFFTTKPTGEGTGLGLSLSHDIITQGHGGTLAVESQPGQSTTFIIFIPA